MLGMQKGSGKSVRKLRFQILYTVRGMLLYHQLKLEKKNKIHLYIGTQAVYHKSWKLQCHQEADIYKM